MRVLIGTTEISGLSPHLADGFERLGHDATTAMCFASESFANLLYHLDIGEDTRRVDWREVRCWFRKRSFRLPDTVTPRHSSLKRILWLIENHDVFLFTFTSLWHDRHLRPYWRGIGRDFPLLKSLGKRVIAYFLGPEVRNAEAYEQQTSHLGLGHLRLRDVARWGRDPLRRTLRNLRRAELHADLIVSQPNQASLALRPYHHLDVPLALDGIECNIPGRRVPVVVHAPSSKSIKGTGAILEALDRLRARGVAFELRLLDQAPHAEVMAALRDADVVVDQLHLPLHGKLGVEAMASGCALASCDVPELEPIPARRPVWPIDRRSVEAQLERLLTDRSLRLRLAERARSHVERHHDHVRVVQRLVEALEGKVPCDHRPTFFAQHYRLPPGERISRAMKGATRRIIERWGLPEGVSPASLEARGLM